MENFAISSGAVLDQNGFIQSYPVGTIIMSLSSVIPDGWLLCDGSEVSSSDYPNLYSVLGNTYGGSGLNFKVPPIVYHATNNPNPRIPFSTKSSESLYPNSFSHNHDVPINAAVFESHTHFHNHNTNSGTVPETGDNHNHGGAGGSTSGSNVSGGSSSGRATGPNGPYASGPSGGTNHSHGGVGTNSGGTNGAGWNHSHGVTLHTQTSYNHNHGTNIANVTQSTSNSTAIYPLSKQVYFLIKC